MIAFLPHSEPNLLSEIFCEIAIDAIGMLQNTENETLIFTNKHIGISAAKLREEISIVGSSLVGHTITARVLFRSDDSGLHVGMLK